jgi:peptide deformylase
MSILEIRTYPDPVLRKLAEPVRQMNDDVLRFSEAMAEAMHLARGVGLAANQVGVPLRIIVIDTKSARLQKPLTIINPELVAAEEEEITEEGCLSLPGFYEYVKRAKKVHVRGMNEKEEPLELTCEGHLARAFQHEIDHLNGVLFIDHLSPVKKHLFKKRYVKSGR